MEMTSDKVIKFKLDDEYFAISVNEVKEVVKMQNLTKIPNSPPHVDGIMDLRGVVCTIIDPKKLLQIVGEKQGNERKVIVLDIGENMAGIKVDEVYSVDDFSEEELDANTYAGQFAKGVIKDEIDGNSELVIWLDVEKLIGDTEMSQVA